ncbi:hypothetical protein D6D19_03595 [Aureobasidium pullulans]|uniref:Uncharacterized protein n=1 Tax=Aureobasidium pullulans TaxID=5580 RepID=A0A4V4IRZ5_AURPU|nr:hypothetical protein D6D19_03595 [Aureobasidium pullulans]
MDEPEPRSTKDAPYVKKTLEHADDLCDAGSYQECLTTLLDLLENYHMAVLPRMKVLIMLSTLVEDWQYAEDWRMNAEDIYLYCDRHRNEVFNDIVLRMFRTTLDRLEPSRRDVSDMTDEEVKFRADITGIVVGGPPPLAPSPRVEIEKTLTFLRGTPRCHWLVAVPHWIQEATSVNEIDEALHFAYREALISHYASLHPTGSVPNNVPEPPATTATSTTTTKNAETTSIQLPLRNLRETPAAAENSKVRRQLV